MQGKLNYAVNMSTRVHDRLTNDFLFFAKHCLQVKNKAGRLVPFDLNKAQTHIHNRVEEQKRLTGRVRALIPKARQGGISTYVSGRFYRRNNRVPNTSTFILSHQSKTTAALFNMVDRYHENCPDAAKPKAIVSNKNQLKFENGSEYTVGTAGSGDVGRGFTTQLLHISEAAFCENTDEIQTGILQSVSDEDDTEIFVESTGNGMGNWFYRACMDALAGKGDYILIFIPWFWMPEYRRPVPEDFVLTAEEAEFIKTYSTEDEPIDHEQIYWRRKKIEDLGSEWKFKQEYPSNVMECFQTSGNPLINAEKAMQARKNKIVDRSGPVILGVDPHGGGKSKSGRTTFVYRTPYAVVDYKVYEEIEPMRTVSLIANAIETKGVDMVFIDYGYGHAIANRLKEMGYGSKVITVNFSETPMENDKYLNKRAEMACNARDWMEEGDKSIPDDDTFYSDIMCIPRERETSRGLFYIESKDKIKEDYGRSPDISDAWWLTFAYPVRKNTEGNKIRKKVDRVTGKSGGPLKTLNRARRR